MIPITVEVFRIEIAIMGHRIRRVLSLLGRHRGRTFRHPVCRGQVIAVIAPTTRPLGYHDSREIRRSKTPVLLGSPKAIDLRDARLPQIAYDPEGNLPRIDLPWLGLRVPGTRGRESNPRRLVRRAAVTLTARPAPPRPPIVPQPRADASRLESPNEHPSHHVWNT